MKVLALDLGSPRHVSRPVALNSSFSKEGKLQFACWLPESLESKQHKIEIQNVLNINK